MTEWVVVVSNGNAYHKPASPRDDGVDPEPACRDPECYQGANLLWRRKAVAVDWQDPCTWCYGEVPAGKGAGNAPAIGGESDD